MRYGYAWVGVSAQAVGLNGYPPPQVNAGNNSGAAFCVLYGTNQPFDAATLQQLYPSHRRYVQGVAASAFKNLLAGYILGEAAWTFVRDAESADVPPP